MWGCSTSWPLLVVAILLVSGQEESSACPLQLSCGQAICPIARKVLLGDPGDSCRTQQLAWAVRPQIDTVNFEGYTLKINVAARDSLSNGAPSFHALVFQDDAQYENFAACRPYSAQASFSLLDCFNNEFLYLVNANETRNQVLVLMCLTSSCLMEAQYRYTVQFSPAFLAVVILGITLGIVAVALAIVSVFVVRPSLRRVFLLFFVVIIVFVALSIWFWSAILVELYGSGSSQKIARWMISWMEKLTLIMSVLLHQMLLYDLVVAKHAISETKVTLAFVIFFIASSVVSLALLVAFSVTRLNAIVMAFYGWVFLLLIVLCILFVIYGVFLVRVLKDPSSKVQIMVFVASILFINIGRIVVFSYFGIRFLFSPDMLFVRVPGLFVSFVNLSSAYVFFVFVILLPMSVPPVILSWILVAKARKLSSNNDSDGIRESLLQNDAAVPAVYSDL